MCLTCMSNSAPQQSGFALLMTIMVVSVLVLIALTILDISIKTLALSNNAAQSEIAFHAANAAMECARFTRTENRDDFIEGDDVDIDCFGASSEPDMEEGDTVGGVTYNIVGSGEDANSQVFTYHFDIDHGSPQRCSEATIVVLDSENASAYIGDDSNPNVDSTHYFPWDEGRFACPLFSTCTFIYARGYNTSCSNAIGGTGEFLQREILLRF